MTDAPTQTSPSQPRRSRGAVPHVDPEWGPEIVDDSGFVIELSAARQVPAGSIDSVTESASLLESVRLSDLPYLVRGSARVESDIVVVVVQATGHGPCDAIARASAESCLQDLWHAVHLGAGPDAAHVWSGAQLLGLARARRALG